MKDCSIDQVFEIYLKWYVMLIRIDSWRSKSHHCPPKDSRRLDPSFQSRPANSLINIYPDRCSIRPAFIYTQVLFHPFDNVTIVRLIEWEESLCRFFVTMEYISWRDALDGSIASSAASFSPLPFFFPLSFYESTVFTRPSCEISPPRSFLPNPRIYSMPASRNYGKLN